MAEEQAFQAWYARSERHAQAYQRLAVIWDVAGRAWPTGQAVNFPLWARLGASPRMALMGSLLAIAALGLALLVGGGTRLATPDPLILASAIGEIRPYRFGDGSDVVLDTRSRIAIKQGEGKRRLFLLDGRARFRTPPGEPLEVRVGGHALIAREGVFDVSLIDGEPAVLLLSGTLWVRLPDHSDGRRAVRLEAGETVVLGSMHVQPSGRMDASWPQRMLVLDQTPLSDALALANRYTRIQVRLADAVLSRRAVTGAFRVGDAEAFARSLAVALDLGIRNPGDGTIVLSPRGVR